MRLYSKIQFVLIILLTLSLVTPNPFVYRSDSTALAASSGPGVSIKSTAEQPKSLPPESKISCYDGLNGEYISSCPILEWGGYTYWVYSNSQNDFSMIIGAYDTNGNLISYKEYYGARYINQVTVDDAAEQLTLYGQANSTITIPWSELTALQTPMTVTSISVSPNPALPDNTVKIMATVRTLSGGIVDEGSVTFKMNGSYYWMGSLNAQGQTANYSKFSGISDPYIADFTFNAEYTGVDQKFKASSSDQAKLRVTSVSYNVSFDTNGGSFLSPLTVADGTSLTGSYTTTRPGYLFDGWYSDSGFGQKVVFPLTVNANTTLYAKWLLTPPIGSITINNGAVYTNSSNVTLNLSASDLDTSDVLQMRFSNDNTTWSSWENTAASKSWSLGGGDGVKSVYYQLTDGVSTTTYSDTIVRDTVRPSVTGVVDGGVYNSNRTITFNEGTATLNSNNFTSGSTVSGEGAYQLVVTDAAGNLTTITFTIDKTAPVISNVADGASYNSDRTITFNEGTATLNGVLFTSGSTVSEEGDYTLAATDAAGNVKTVNFSIDKTAPVVSGVANGQNYKTDQTITFNEGTATLNGAPFTSSSNVSLEDNYTLVVTDAAGNVTTVNFTIDRTSPAVSGVTDGANYNTDKTITFDEGTATLNGDPFVNGETVSTEGDFTLVVTDPAGNVNTVSFLIDKTNPIITGITTGTSNYYSPITIGFNEGTATLNGNPFTSGTRITSPGSYTLVVTDAAGNQTSVTFTLSISSAQSGYNLEIEINGVKVKDLGKETTAIINGEKVTTVTFDETKLSRYLDSIPNTPPVILIPIHNDSDRVILSINGELIKQLYDKSSSIQMETELASYVLAAKQIDWSLIGKSFESKNELRNMVFDIEIAHVTNGVIEQAVNKLGDADLVSPVIDFSITAMYNGKTIKINKFLSYIERTIAIPDSANADGINMTGVTITNEGNIVPVPTRIVKENGKTYAVINSLTNSVYAVVANDKTFADIQKHWAKNDIEQAAAKLIVQGVSDTSFQPNKQITRAEFTAMLVRALGLHTFGQPASFSDIKSGQWYSDVVSIAESYGLVKASIGSLYNPNEKLNRKEAMILLVKAMKLAGMNTTITDSEISQQLTEFKDNHLLDSSARAAAALNVKYGIIIGNQGKLTPDNVITRAETTVILQRFLEAAKLG